MILGFMSGLSGAFVAAFWGLHLGAILRASLVVSGASRRRLRVVFGAFWASRSVLERTWAGHPARARARAQAGHREQAQAGHPDRDQAGPPDWDHNLIFIYLFHICKSFIFFKSLTRSKDPSMCLRSILARCWVDLGSIFG